MIETQPAVEPKTREPVTLNLDEVNQQLEGLPPQEIIAWAHKTFGQGLGMLSSMQKTASALTHMLYRLDLCQVDILFIDTQYHFPETLQIRDRMIQEYGVNIITIKPKQTPEEQFRTYGRELYLSQEGYRLCCKLRKEEPFLQAAQPYQAMLSGLMRAEGGARKNIPIVAEDPRIEGYKVHPLANWNRDDLERYLAEEDVLVHPLHAQGYPSIGCATCTTPVRPGEDERAGRWRHIREANPNGGETKLYCGINFSDQKS